MIDSPPTARLRSLQFLAAICAVFAGSSQLTVTWSQEMKVRVGEGPHYVGDTIRLQVQVSGLDDEPELDIGKASEESVKTRFLNSDQSSVTKFFNGRVIRDEASLNFNYAIDVSEPGEFTIGPFTASLNGKPKLRHDAVALKVLDVETRSDMQVDIVVPDRGFYPGQQIPVDVRVTYAGEFRRLDQLQIQTSLFDSFKVPQTVGDNLRYVLPVVTDRGMMKLPARLSREKGSEGEREVLRARLRLVADVPQVVIGSPPVLVFREVTGVRRGTSIFDRPRRTVSGPRKAVGKPVRIEIKPFPSKGRPKSFQGAVGESFSIATRVNRDQIRVGDPLTLEIEITGDGDLGPIGVPDLGDSLPEDQFEFPRESVGGVLSTDTKQFSIPLRVMSKNVTEVPPIKFSWFDPLKESYVTISATAIPLDVREGQIVSSSSVIREGSAAANTTGPPSSSSSEANGPALDLAIETDPQKILKSGNTARFVWVETTFYALGIALILFSMWDMGRTKILEKSIDVRAIVQQAKDRVQDLQPMQTRELAEVLRRLQGVIESKAEFRQQSPVERETLDRLIADLDALNFKPGGSSDDAEGDLHRRAVELFESTSKGGRA